MQRDDIIRAIKGHEAVPRSHAERLVESDEPHHRAIVRQLRERLCVVCGVGMGRLGESRTAHPWCEREGAA